MFAGKGRRWLVCGSGWVGRVGGWQKEKRDRGELVRSGDGGGKGLQLSKLCSVGGVPTCSSHTLVTSTWFFSSCQSNNNRVKYQGRESFNNEWEMERKERQTKWVVTEAGCVHSLCAPWDTPSHLHVSRYTNHLASSIPCIRPVHRACGARLHQQQSSDSVPLYASNLNICPHPYATHAQANKALLRTMIKYVAELWLSCDNCILDAFFLEAF